MSYKPRLPGILFSLVALAPILGIASLIYAQAETVAPETENTKFMATGIINSAGAKVLSGPGANYYATGKLDKGARVTVVGIKFDYLKIVPPEGSFCYIAKSYVERRNDGSVGRVTRDLVNVHAGSSLGGMKVVTLCQLSTGADVQIIGEQDEYFKIKPPEKAYLYIDKRSVDQDVASVRPQAPVGAPVTPSPRPRPEAAVGQERVDSTPATPATNPGTETAMTSTDPTASILPPVVPTTGPSAEAVAAAETAFQSAEDAFNAANKKSLDQQPLDELIKSYQVLVQDQDGALAPSLRRIAEARLSALKVRSDAATELATVRKNEDELKKKQQALAAEHEELEQRLAASGVVRYAAVGTLQPSSLQQGKETLYRLTDPSTGRTVVYIRSNDGKLLGLLNQFIGVKGTVAVDAQLNIKVISPSDFAVVDPTKLSANISADILPPSLMPKATASTGE